MFTIFFFQSIKSRLLQATYSWTIVRGYRRKEYTVFFADFLDCNSAPGMDDLLFVFFCHFSLQWYPFRFLFIDLSLIFMCTHVSSRLFYFSWFVPSLLPTFSRFLRLYLFMAVQIYEGSIIISGGLWALIVHSWSFSLAILTLFYTALCFWFFSSFLTFFLA